MNSLIIITGIGDHTSYIEYLTKNWSVRFGLQVTVYRYGWRGTSKELGSRENSLLQIIDQLSSKDDRVSLLGISAGASAALNALSARPHRIHKVVTVCGRLRRGGRSIFKFKNFPLYWRSVDKLKESLPKLPFHKILVLYPIYDPVTPIQTVQLKGGQNQKIATIGHISGIMYILKSQSRKIAEFISD